jgi:hypothetical protein
MSESAIRQKIFDILAGREGLAEPLYASDSLGMVHKYERWAADWAKFLTFFKDPVSARIFGWEIRRSNMQSVKLGAFEEQNTHGYLLKGYLGVQDADGTEILFNAKVEEVCGLFRGNHTLGGVCLDAGPVSVELIEERFFGSVLCHYAELRLPVTEIQ